MVLTIAQGAHVIAAEINPIALKNAKENFEKHKVNIETVESDIFSNIPK